MKIAVTYFSGTDVTAIVARSVSRRLTELGYETEMTDITPKRTRDSFDADRFDAFVFGAPVYADFAPSAVNEWLESLEGNNRPCVIYCTYGGRTSGYFHFHTWQILRKRGFVVLMSAEFLGRHTFNVAGWNVLPDRPDDSDLLIAGELAEKSAELFSEEEPAPLFLQKPLGYKEKLASLKNRAPQLKPSPNQPFRKPMTAPGAVSARETVPREHSMQRRDRPLPSYASNARDASFTAQTRFWCCMRTCTAATKGF